MLNKELEFWILFSGKWLQKIYGIVNEFFWGIGNGFFVQGQIPYPCTCTLVGFGCEKICKLPFSVCFCGQKPTIIPIRKIGVLAARVPLVYCWLFWCGMVSRSPPRWLSVAPDWYRASLRIWENSLKFVHHCTEILWACKTTVGLVFFPFCRCPGCWSDSQ